MDCYTELLPPTAVTHAIALPFLALGANNLIVAKTSLLQVFNIITTDHDQEGEKVKDKLALVGEYPLAGTVTNIARVKLLESKAGGEAVLISFDRAKLSLLEWDPDNHRPSTVSIHYYESEHVLDQPFGSGLETGDAILTIDPSSRCAAFRFAARHLAILPFKQANDDLIGEEDDGLDNQTSLRGKSSGHDNAEDHAVETPYKPSFVLPLTALDNGLNSVVHLAFLHEYREPTFGILASAVAVSAALAAERKDMMTFTVFTLDLEQRASTNLITVNKLPSTLHRVVPLPLPIGGALLIGANEVVHIDQSGKTNATAVNEFAKLESDFGMADQSHLGMKLEDCVVEVFDPDSGELLFALKDGSLAILSFKVLRRSISELVMTRVSSANVTPFLLAPPSCLTRLTNGDVFIGSQDGASSLLACSNLQSDPSRKRSHAQMASSNGTDEDDGDEAEEDEDDLYSTAPAAKKRAISQVAASGESDPSAYMFDVQDTIPSIGPINQICLGQCRDSRTDKMELLAGTGRGSASHLTVMNRDIVPELSKATHLDGITEVWAMRMVESEDDTSSKTETDGQDTLMVCNIGSLSKVLSWSGPGSNQGELMPKEAAEFDEEGTSLHVSTLRAGTRLVQCRRTDIRIYASNLTLSQIIAMEDEDTGAEVNIVHASACDPYLLIIRDDSSVQILQVQGEEVDFIDATGEIKAKKWMSGCIYAGPLTRELPVLFLLSKEGAMHIFSLPGLQQISVAPSLPHLSPVFSMDTSQRRMGSKETLAELLVADLGHDQVYQTYLILRTAMDDIVLYEPFVRHPLAMDEAWHTGLRFRKVHMPYIPKYNESIAESLQSRPMPLKPLRVGRFKAVCIPGMPASLILKDPTSLPKVLEMRSPEATTKVQTLSSLNTSSCCNGFMAVGADSMLQEFQLPSDVWIGTGWSVRQMKLSGPDQEVRQVAYHAPLGLYVVATCHYVDFYFSEDDNRHPDQDDITIRPKVPQYSIHLVSSLSREIIDTYEMPYLHCVTSLKVMPLEVSEVSHEQRSMIVVGSAALRGEDMPAKGTITVLDIIDVVPDPDRVESGKKLHVTSTEDTKGAITAIDSFPGGLIGTAQGQKVMVRGLKEDGSCLPIAFLDAQCHATTLKTLPGKGLWLLGDAWKGLCFGGFTEEPYKITVLGKSRTDIEVVSAEFLPFDGQLFILAIDESMDLHMLQYDPENPKTISGMRLLHRSSFHLGHFPTSTTLLPSALATFAEQEAALGNDPSGVDSTSLSHILTTSQTGSIGLVTPLDESTYRRLSALQTHLSSILEHTGGLNPRAYRAAVEGEGFSGRGIVDGSIVRRIFELGAPKRNDILSRAGGDTWTLRSDLEIIGGGGLSYL